MSETGPNPPGELDLYLFGEGQHRRLWEMLGAHTVDAGGTTFAVWAPNATEVSVVGDWNHWSHGVDHLEIQDGSGVWWGWVEHAVEGQAYKFHLTTKHGEVLERADPMARAAEEPPRTASRIARHAGSWSESGQEWRTRRAARNGGRLAIYELHARAWRHHDDGRAMSFRELAEPLAEHVARLGFTHVEFMPLASHPYGGSWGYQLTGFYAPDARGGTPDDLRFLIDTLHERDIGVIVDWVPAHFARDDGALARFDGTALYEHADPRRGEHPDWGTYVFNHGRHEVRNFLVANALYWLEEFRLDGLRVDAVASMLYLDYSRSDGEWTPNPFGGREDLDAIEFLRSLNRSVGADHEGALVIAEESTAWPRVTAMAHEGGLGFTHKQNLGWMHDTLGYLVRDPIHRRWHQHDLLRPFVYAYDERWVLPLSHDEFVHGKGSWVTRFPGDRWQQLANLRTLLAWQWCSPGAPMIFMGAEIAAEREFDEQRSLDWHLAADPAHGGVGALIGALNRLAERYPALWRDDRDWASWQWLDADDSEHSLVAFIRVETSAGDSTTVSGAGSIVGVANFTPTPLDGYRIGLPEPGCWRSVLDTDSSEFGGSGYALRDRIVVADREIAWQGQPYSGVISVPPLSVTLYAAEP